MVGSINRRTAVVAGLILTISTAAVFVLSQKSGIESADPGKSGSPSRVWKTDFSKRSVELDEILAGGPPKDGIPALDEPKFVTLETASGWLRDREPVISLVVEGEARAYPLQILIWHEIVNDRIEGVPVAVTFCPLCYSAIVFHREVDGTTHVFGVTGLLRHSDMIMFDRETETWWQQFSGEAVVGKLTGKKLKRLAAQIVSFRQFAESYPKGTVLSRETGFEREYGRNPYVGYDDIDQKPFMFKGKTDQRLRPMEKVVAVEIGGVTKAYPHTITRRKRVVYDRILGQEIVILHADGATSALDRSEMGDSRESGSTGVFLPFIDGVRLTFSYKGGYFVDRETQSTWSITGRSTGGLLNGRQLERVPHGDYFAFAWLVFNPDTGIYAEPVKK